MTNKQKNILTEIETKLRKYCHRKNCKDYRNCPKDCKCNRSLGLDTAIAWEAANIIQICIIGAITRNKLLDDLYLLFIIVEHHQDKYATLFELIHKLCKRYDR